MKKRTTAPNVSQTLDEKAADSTEELHAIPRRCSAKRRRRLAVLSCSLLLIATVVAFSPTVITKTALPNRLLANALPSKAGFLTMSSVSVGWWKPLRIKGLCLFDAAGELVIEAPQIELDRGLLRLLLNQSQLGNIVVRDAQLDLSLTRTGSNVERLLEILREAADECEGGSDDSIAIESLQLVNAELGIRDEVTESTWNVQDIAAKVVSANGWTATATGLLDKDAFELRLSLPCSTNESLQDKVNGHAGKMSLKAEHIPLAILQPVARRCDLSFEQLSGATVIDATLQWDTRETMFAVGVDGTLDIDGLVAQGGPLALRDSLRVKHLRVAAGCQLKRGQLKIDRLELESDFGSMNCVGELAIDQLMTTQMMQALASAKLETQGTLDLAALVAALPNTLHLQSNVSIPSGSLTWQLEGIPTADTALWTGKLTSAGIHLLKAGQPIQWEPVQVSFRVAVGQAFQLNHLTLRSESIALNAQGDAKAGELSYQVDFDRLIQNASQIIDLDGSRVAGNLQGALHWQAVQPTQVELKIDAGLKNAVYTRHGRMVWKEPSLRFTSNALVTHGGLELRSIDYGNVKVAATQDSCILSIEQPLNLKTDGPPASISCELRGDVARWVQRCSVLGGFSPGNAQGHVIAKGVGRVERNRLRFDSLDVTLKNFSAGSAKYRFDEPVVRVAVTAEIQPGQLQVENLTCTSPSLALVVRDSLVTFEDAVSVVANVGYRADLHRVLSPQLNSIPDTRGTSVGQLQIQHASFVTDVRFRGRVDDFRTHGALGTWQEAKLILCGEGSYDHLADQVRFQQLELSGKDVHLTAIGSLSQFTKRPVANVSGQYDSRLQKWVDVARIPRSQVLIDGRTTQAFAIRGPLFSPGTSWCVSRDLEIETGIEWDSAKLLGTPVAGQALRLQLRDGTLHSSRFSTAFGSGQIAFSPRLNFNALGPTLSLASGRVIDQVTITPEVARRWLKYAAPLLADITSAQAKFSFDVEQAAVPVTNPYAAQVLGRLAIHQGRVGPGTLALQCIEVMTQLKRLAGRGSGRVVNPDRLAIELPEQVIDVQVVGERVYHEGFLMVVDGLPVRTRGSVHMANESLSLIAEIVLSGTLAAGSERDVMAIPISGTLSRPVLDRRALAKISRALARNAAGRYLRKGLSEKVSGDVGDRLGDLLGGDSKDVGDILEDELGRQLKRLLN